MVVIKLNYKFPFLNFLRLLKLLHNSLGENLSLIILTMSAYVHSGEDFNKISEGLRQEIWPHRVPWLFYCALGYG